MYNNLKKIIHSVLSKKNIFKIEPYLRRGWSVFYLGSKHQCTICKTKFKNWISLPNQDNVCPRCGSLSRDRRLWQLIEQNYLKPHSNVLDFSPSRSLFRIWKKQHTYYTATDLSGDFISDNQYDITAIPEDENTFDLIICYHVLEHVIEDRKAMNELYRILKPTGTLLVQTPFKEGDIYEDYSITTKEERLKHFEQEDHVRIYSVEGLKNRLTKSGFKVEIKPFKKDTFYGLTDNEIIFVLKKN
ncbi:class I SAM-dependent methyltransferase [Flavobacterium sp. NG2]|uniref:class I SAM-dependent methyltransferase n=1 Tax=Flavobacterium sp. NG2 TaxID=3097547 RepID=UPI002A7F9CA4|nr:class I SAM-dependent methyltransferase [Flavobacterium sp. NG2]WPR70205.1 class I SAM-dependent methyltransferase [Flavobacterium sp. NG2]